MVANRVPLKIDVPADLERIAEVFRAGGHVLYLVGGAVRDAVLGLVPKDFDVATDATPERVKELLGPLGVPLLEVGISFGVVVAVLPPPLEKMEIATFRVDLTTGRHPNVCFATINEDVMRRDLTINALFYDIVSCEVVDLVGGLNDIREEVIRTVGNPDDRFNEDRLRVLRAVRFAARLGYDMHPETFDAIRRNCTLDGVSHERIHDELVKSISTAKNVPRFFEMMDDLGLWIVTLPHLHASTKGDSLVSTRGFDTNNVAIALAMLLDAYDSNNDIAFLVKKLLALKYSTDEVSRVSFLLRFRRLDADVAYNMRKSFVSSGLTLDELSQYFIQRGMPSRGLFEAFVSYLDTPPVSGDALLAEGYSGKALGVELGRRERESFERLLT